jgi:hypothetical protein
MAKNLQEALLEVQEDLKRIGLEVKGEDDHKWAKRKRHHKRSASARQGIPSQQSSK